MHGEEILSKYLHQFIYFLTVFSATFFQNKIWRKNILENYLKINIIFIYNKVFKIFFYL